jgi:hypothetical protein
LSAHQINKIARQTGFMKLDSPLDGAGFLKLLFCNSEQDRNLSLLQLSNKVLHSNGKSLSKQAIDARFSKKSTLFIKTIFEAFLQKMNQSHLADIDDGWMSSFKRILVKDGTRFDLPKAFATHYAGFGGSCTSDAAICIQFEFDLKTGKIADFNLTSANIPDCKDAQLTKDHFQEGDLILRDLGYFGLNIFEQMKSEKVYFISKLNTQVSVFQLIKEQYQILDFIKIYQQMQHTGVNTIELEVFIGKTSKMPVRLIIEKVPQQVYEERIRSRKKQSQKEGYNMREEYAARQHFNTYITNIEKEKLQSQSIRNIYRLRWQVELIFKRWKSTYKIDKTHQMKYDRWMTLFYARMLLMLIHWQLYHYVKNAKYKYQNKLLSISKCLQSFKLNTSKITSLIYKGSATLRKAMKELIQIIATKHDLEVKKGRMSQQEIMEIIYCE